MTKTEIPKKVAVITGTTSGIGMYTARKLAADNTKLILVNRNAAATRAQITELKAQSGNHDIYGVVVDLGSFASIRQAVEEINALTPVLHLLINNAGALCSKKESTSSGIDKNLIVNYLGPFLFTWLLLDRLAAASASRIVMLVSGAHFKAPWNTRTPDFIRHIRPLDAYLNAKLASVAFTLKLASLLQGTNISVNCLHPGRVATDLFFHKYWWFYPIKPIANLFLLQPEQAAESSLFLAEGSGATDCSGRYFNEHGRSCAPAARTLSLEFQDELWLESKRLLNLLAKPDPSPELLVKP